MNKELESKTQQDIKEALGLCDDLVLWRNNTGVAREHDCRSGRMRVVRYGLGVGSADLVGILRRDVGGPWPDRYVGVFFALEIKRPGGKARLEQRTWGETVQYRGGFYAVVDSVESAKAALDRARAGAVS